MKCERNGGEELKNRIAKRAVSPKRPVRNYISTVEDNDVFSEWQLAFFCRSSNQHEALKIVQTVRRRLKDTGRQMGVT